MCSKPVSVARTMPFKSAMPGLVPHFDVTVHIVLDDFGKEGRAYRETDEEDTNFGSVVDDLLTGQFNNPVRVGGLQHVRRVVAGCLRGCRARGSAARSGIQPASRGQFAAIRSEICRRGRTIACRKRRSVNARGQRGASLDFRQWVAAEQHRKTVRTSGKRRWPRHSSAR